MLLNNEWIKNKIKKEIRKFLETNENQHIIVQNLWGTAKAVPRGKFTVTQVSLKKIETFQINNLTLHLHELEEQQQTSSGVSRQKEMTKVRAELNDVGLKEQLKGSISPRGGSLKR